MEQTKKFSYSFYDSFNYSGEYDSIEEALAAAKVDAKNDNEFKDAKTVHIGRVYKFVPVVAAWRIIDQLQDMAVDEADEVAYDYLKDVSDDDENKLEAMLTETFNKWAAETGNEPNFFTVEEVEAYSLEGQEQHDD